MPQPGTRGRWRWLIPSILLGATLLAGGFGWWRYGPRSDSLSRGRAAYSLGDWETAANLARLRLKAASEDLDGVRLLARASVRLGRDSSATGLYQRIGPSAMEAEDLYLLGLAMTRAGKTKSATEVWERARSLDPEHSETLFELTRAYFANDRLDPAAALAGILATRPGWESRAEAILGMIQLERNDPAGAVEFWQRALGRKEVRLEGVPSPIVPRKELAHALLRVARPREARDQLAIVLGDSPDPEAYWLLSRAALQEGAWNEAREALKKGSGFRDENPQVPDPSPYVGSSRCGECHPAESKAQQVSRHARTFFRASELGGLVLPGSTVSDPADRKVEHELRRKADSRINLETRVDGQVLDAVVQYAFGSGDRGLTLVGRNEKGKAYELRLSDYPDGPDACWDVTAGHPRIPPKAEEFLGQPLTEDAVRRCLSCHVTDPKAILDRSGACAADRGIGCEKCHGPAGNHLLAADAKLTAIDAAIGRPSLTSGSRVMKICAECHSPRGQEVLRDDPGAVRFQGTTLTWSRCYTESNDTLDCTTCHNPHRNASTSPTYYESRCLSCHSGAEEAADFGDRGDEG